MAEEQRPDQRGPDDRARFQAVYEAQYRAVLAYARRRAAEVADAEDVVAETFTIAWRRLDEVPEGTAALPWLYGVARRVLANQRRGERRRTDLTTRLRSHGSETADHVETRAVVDEERRTVLAVLGRLRDGDQELLRLAVWEELPHRDIAEVLGCPERSVAVRLHRARNRLAREMEKEMRRSRQVDPRGAGRRTEGDNP